MVMLAFCILVDDIVVLVNKSNAFNLIMLVYMFVFRHPKSYSGLHSFASNAVQACSQICHADFDGHKPPKTLAPTFLVISKKCIVCIGLVNTYRLTLYKSATLSLKPITLKCVPLLVRFVTITTWTVVQCF